MKYIIILLSTFLIAFNSISQTQFHSDTMKCERYISEDSLRAIRKAYDKKVTILNDNGDTVGYKMCEMFNPGIISINQYRKKNKGAWKKIRVHTKVQVYGDVLEFGVDENGAYVDCDNKISFNTNGSNKFAEKYKTKTLKHKVTDVPTKTRSSWVKGYHRSYMDETLEFHSVMDY